MTGTNENDCVEVDAKGELELVLKSKLMVFSDERRCGMSKQDSK